MRIGRVTKEGMRIGSSTDVCIVVAFFYGPSRIASVPMSSQSCFFASRFLAHFGSSHEPQETCESQGSLLARA